MATDKVGSTTVTPKKTPSQRIPPSGTPVKHDPDTPASSASVKRIITRTTTVSAHEEASTKSSSSDSEFEETMDVKGQTKIQIAHLKAEFSEFTHVFPAFPKTHENGYAYIIELSPEILNEKALLDLRDALQYSLTGGGGPRTLDNVEFFAIEGKKVPMKIHFRRCAGTFLPVIYKLKYRG